MNKVEKIELAIGELKTMLQGLEKREEVSYWIDSIIPEPNGVVVKTTYYFHDGKACQTKNH